jgi:16S rRNA (guanine966-N2)-methyltransferase
MRIIAGQAKGHRLMCLPGMSVRPTQDRIREAIFSSLAFRLPKARVLDLFAGTGAMSLEAVSRGAAEAVCVEQNPKACQLIIENSLHCKLNHKISIIQKDVIHFLKNADQLTRFDIIVADPPYYEGYYDKLFQEITNCGILNRKGILVVEAPQKLTLPQNYGELVCTKIRKYGITTVVYYEYQD